MTIPFTKALQITLIRFHRFWQSAIPKGKRRVARFPFRLYVSYAHPFDWHEYNSRVSYL